MHLLFWWAKPFPQLLLPIVVQMGSAILLSDPTLLATAELGKGACPHLPIKSFPGIFKLGIVVLVPLWKWNLQCEPESFWKLCKESQRARERDVVKWFGYILSLIPAISEAQLHLCNWIMWIDCLFIYFAWVGLSWVSVNYILLIELVIGHSDGTTIFSKKKISARIVCWTIHTSMV